mgnify:CR=1 FL=1
MGLQIEEQYRDVRYLNNCIKDIKSLKILYPSGLGCAIEMVSLIKCIVSILELKANERANLS